MIIAFTTKDKKIIDDFNNPILVIDTNTNTKEEKNYLEAMSYCDVLVTSHLDGFASEDVKKYGVTPIIYRGSIEDAIIDIKDSGLKRTMPIGTNEGCGSCAI